MECLNGFTITFVVKVLLVLPLIMLQHSSENLILSLYWCSASHLYYLFGTISQNLETLSEFLLCIDWITYQKPCSDESLVLKWWSLFSWWLNIFNLFSYLVHICFCRLSGQTSVNHYLILWEVMLLIYYLVRGFVLMIFLLLIVITYFSICLHIWQWPV